MGLLKWHVSVSLKSNQQSRGYTKENTVWDQIPY